MEVSSMNLPLNINWQQILLHMFNFAILAGGLYMLLYKPVKDFMDKRTEYYKNLDDEAQKKLAHADELKKQYEDRLHQADAQADEIVSKASAQAASEAEAMLDKARAQKDQIIAQAHTTAEQERQKAVQKAREDIVDLAVAATARMMQSKENPNE